LQVAYVFRVELGLTVHQAVCGERETLFDDLIVCTEVCVCAAEDDNLLESFGEPIFLWARAQFGEDFLQGVPADARGQEE
jgi:hypothetical protein